ncbi:MAG: ArsR/SmtB family transcription factor [Phycisphaerales bacterium]
MEKTNKMHPDAGMKGLAEAAECLRTIAHPHRLRMIQLMLQDRYTVGELAESCGIPSAAASGHLRILKDRGFLEQDRYGRTVYYRIVEPQLSSILSCVENRFGCGLDSNSENRK